MRLCGELNYSSAGVGVAVKAVSGSAVPPPSFPPTQLSFFNGPLPETNAILVHMVNSQSVGQATIITKANSARQCAYVKTLATT